MARIMNDFCEYELIEHRMYIGHKERAYDRLTENDDSIELCRNY